MNGSRTFVYVSNAADGTIGACRLFDSGELGPPAVFAAPGMVMPMAVSPDRRFLYAAARSKPYSVHAFAIDPDTGALAPLGTSPLAESFPYIALDRTGRYLFGASYGGNLVGVSAIEAEGRVAAEPLQVIPTGRNAHSIGIDNGNRFAFVPHLGSDEIFQFVFDEKSGMLRANTPAAVKVKAMTGPRHLAFAPDNRFVYVLNEFLATVTTFALDAKSGLLSEVATASSLPADSGLVPGAPRGAVGAPGQAARNTDSDIWAADLHLTADGRFLYTSERTGSTLSAFRVDGGAGTLALIGIWPTAQQPRGFAIDPAGRFLVASGEKSATLSVHAIDQASGALTFAGKAPAGKGANWVEIVRFP